MPWTTPPSHKSEGIEPVITNILAYITANQVAALTWANGGTALSSFYKLYNSSEGRAYTEFPILAVTGVETEDEESDDGFSVPVKHRIGFQMMIVGPDPDTLTLTMYRYMRAVKAMIRTMTDAELTSTMTSTGHAQVLGMAAQYDRRLFGNDGGQFLRQMNLGIEIELREVG